MALLDIVQQEEHTSTAILTMMMDRGALRRLNGAGIGPIIPQEQMAHLP